jgi:hypothetical protein
VPGKAVSVQMATDQDTLYERIKTVEGTFPGSFWMSSLLYVHVSGGTEDSVNENVVKLTEEFRVAHTQ